MTQHQNFEISKDITRYWRLELKKIFDFICSRRNFKFSPRSAEWNFGVFSQLKWHPLWLHTGLQFTLVQAYAIHLCSALLAESAQVRRKIQIQAKLYLSISKMNFTLIEFKSNTQFMNSKYGFLLWIMMDTWKTRSQPWRIPEIKWGSNRH